MIYYATPIQVLSFDSTTNIQRIPEKEALNCLKLIVGNSKFLGVDFETSGLDPHTSKVWLLAIGNNDNQLVIRGDLKTTIIQLLEYIIKENILCIAHNAKFEYKIFKKNYDLVPKLNCIMLKEQILKCGLDDKVSLDAIVVRYLNKFLDKSVRNKFIRMNSYDQLNDKDIQYVAGDIAYLLTLNDILNEHLKLQNLLNVNKLEQECMKPYAEMELKGKYVSVPYWKEYVIGYYSKFANKILDTLDDIIISYNPKYENKNKIMDMFTGKPSYFNLVNKKTVPGKRCLVNWNSAPQIINIFKEVYNIDLKPIEKEPKKKATNRKKKAAPSVTGYEQLKKYLNPEFLEINDKDTESQINWVLANRHKTVGIVECLYAYKKISKYLSTYGQSFLDHINPVTGRIHQDIFQLGPDTGRVSSNNPNMQNIPKENRFRHGFRAQDELNYSMLTMDFSGAELRIIADGSKDPTMIECFLNGEDLHSKMGSIMFNVVVSKKENGHLRNKTKTVSFGLAYGASAKKFEGIFGGLEKAEEGLRTYFKAFPFIASFLNKLGASAKNNLISYTFYPYYRQRKYTLNPNLNQKERFTALAEIERQGKNHPIQGTCADIVKTATVMIFNYINNNNLDAFIVNQVHDEIVIEFNHNKLEPESFAKEIEKIALEAGKLCIKSVPMEVEYDIKPYWTK